MAASAPRSIREIISESLQTQYPLNLAETDLVGRGFSSVVYRARGGSNVVKLETHPFKTTIVRAVATGRSIAEAEAELVPSRWDDVRRWRDRHAAVDGVFGGRVVPTEISLATVMVTGEVLQGAVETRSLDIDADGVYSFATYVRRQPFVAAAADEARLSFHGSHAELMRGQDLASYVELSAQLLVAPGVPRVSGVDELLFAAVHGGDPIAPAFADGRTGLLRLLPALRRDPALRASVRDFLGRAHRFALEHDELIDIMGADNVVFRRLDGAWHWVLVDPLPLAVMPLRESLAVLAQPSTIQGMSAAEAGQLSYVLNVMRGHNMVAQALDVPELALELPDVPGARRGVAWSTVLFAIQDAYAPYWGTDWQVRRLARQADPASRAVQGDVQAILGPLLGGAEDDLRQARELVRTQLAQLGADATARWSHARGQVSSAAREADDGAAARRMAEAEDAMRRAWLNARDEIVGAIDRERDRLRDARDS